MSKRVVVTWKDSGSTLTQECFLIAEDDPCYIMTEDEGQIEIPNDSFGDIMKYGFVVFEDDDGLFVLDARKIVNIEDC